MLSTEPNQCDALVCETKRWQPKRMPSRRRGCVCRRRRRRTRRLPHRQGIRWPMAMVTETTTERSDPRRAVRMANHCRTPSPPMRWIMPPPLCRPTPHIPIRRAVHRMAGKTMNCYAWKLQVLRERCSEPPRRRPSFSPRRVRRPVPRPFKSSRRRRLPTARSMSRSPSSWVSQAPLATCQACFRFLLSTKANHLLKHPIQTPPPTILFGSQGASTYHKSSA